MALAMAVEGMTLEKKLEALSRLWDALGKWMPALLREEKHKIPLLERRGYCWGCGHHTGFHGDRGCEFETYEGQCQCEGFKK